MMLAEAGQSPVSAVVVFRRAIFPAVALIGIDPVTSGVGRGVAPFAEDDSAMRR
jgi:hypothetical protein